MKKNKTTIQRIWQHRGTQHEEKQNGNPEKLAT
jgi:hypothetical protein